MHHRENYFHNIFIKTAKLCNQKTFLLDLKRLMKETHFNCVSPEQCFCLKKTFLLLGEDRIRLTSRISLLPLYIFKQKRFGVGEEWWAWKSTGLIRKTQQTKTLLENCMINNNVFYININNCYTLT